MKTSSSNVGEMLERLDTSDDGRVVRFSKTVGESDVYLYAGITGDLHPNHVDLAYMQKTPYQERIAHGSLIIGYTSTTSTMFCRNLQAEYPDVVLVSYGYDRIRFIKAVKFGDTISVTYRLKQVLKEEDKLVSEVHVHNQHGELVVVLTHILKAIPSGSSHG